MPLAAWPTPTAARKILLKPGTYRCIDSARYETRDTLACRRKTREGLYRSYCWDPTFGLKYESHAREPRQLGTAALISCLLSLEVFPFPLFPNTDRISLDNHCISKAPAVHQIAPTDSQSTDRDESSELHQDGQTQETHTTDTDHSGTSASTTPHRHGRPSSDGESPPPEEAATARSFDPYGPPKTAREINEGTKRLLLGRFPATEGYVYGFTHPDDTATMTTTAAKETTHLIKIGRSVDYERRMREFRQRCKYVPRVVFARLMPHHHRIELVVHLQLHNARLRDVGCAGCGARHEEWFRVDVGYARRLVGLWRGFAMCRPYDEQGEMLPVWRERLEEVDLDDGDCWERFVGWDDPSGPLSGWVSSRMIEGIFEL